ncbi:microsomal signal peptidase [Russula aff. rugulosa BPL654]|nr:microsomal signal peptidase [Russula aff. rugulosa BPL654]
MVNLREYLEGKIDFEGQKLVERIAHYATIELAVFAFFIGFLFQSIQVTFITFGLGVTAIFAIIIPPWSMYNKHPVTWLSPKETKKKD